MSTLEEQLRSLTATQLQAVNSFADAVNRTLSKALIAFVRENQFSADGAANRYYSMTPQPSFVDPPVPVPAFVTSPTLVQSVVDSRSYKLDSEFRINSAIPSSKFQEFSAAVGIRLREWLRTAPESITPSPAPDAPPTLLHLVADLSRVIEFRKNVVLVRVPSLLPIALHGLFALKISEVVREFEPASSAIETSALSAAAVVARSASGLGYTCIVRQLASFELDAISRLFDRFFVSSASHLADVLALSHQPTAVLAVRMEDGRWLPALPAPQSSSRKVTAANVTATIPSIPESSARHGRAAWGNVAQQEQQERNASVKAALAAAPSPHDQLLQMCMELGYQVVTLRLHTSPTATELTEGDHLVRDVYRWGTVADDDAGPLLPDAAAVDKYVGILATAPFKLPPARLPFRMSGGGAGGCVVVGDGGTVRVEGGVNGGRWYRGTAIALMEQELALQTTTAAAAKAAYPVVRANTATAPAAAAAAAAPAPAPAAAGEGGSSPTRTKTTQPPKPIQRSIIPSLSSCTGPVEDGDLVTVASGRSRADLAGRVGKMMRLVVVSHAPAGCGGATGGGAGTSSLPTSSTSTSLSDALARAVAAVDAAATADGAAGDAAGGAGGGTAGAADGAALEQPPPQLLDLLHFLSLPTTTFLSSTPPGATCTVQEMTGVARQAAEGLATAIVLRTPSQSPRAAAAGAAAALGAAATAPTQAPAAAATAAATAATAGLAEQDGLVCAEVLFGPMVTTASIPSLSTTTALHNYASSSIRTLVPLGELVRYQSANVKPTVMLSLAAAVDTTKAAAPAPAAAAAAAAAGATAAGDLLIPTLPPFTASPSDTGAATVAAAEALAFTISLITFVGTVCDGSADLQEAPPLLFARGTGVEGKLKRLRTVAAKVQGELEGAQRVFERQYGGGVGKCSAEMESVGRAISLCLRVAKRLAADADAGDDDGAGGEVVGRNVERLDTVSLATLAGMLAVPLLPRQSSGLDAAAAQLEHADGVVPTYGALCGSSGNMSSDGSGSSGGHYGAALPADIAQRAVAPLAVASHAVCNTLLGLRRFRGAQVVRRPADQSLIVSGPVRGVVSFIHTLQQLTQTEAVVLASDVGSSASTTWYQLTEQQREQLEGDGGRLMRTIEASRCGVRLRVLHSYIPRIPAVLSVSCADCSDRAAACEFVEALLDCEAMDMAEARAATSQEESAQLVRVPTRPSDRVVRAGALTSDDDELLLCVCKRDGGYRLLCGHTWHPGCLQESIRNAEPGSCAKLPLLTCKQCRQVVPPATLPHLALTGTQPITDAEAMAVVDAGYVLVDGYYTPTVVNGGVVEDHTGTVTLEGFSGVCAYGDYARVALYHEATRVPYCFSCPSLDNCDGVTIPVYPSVDVSGTVISTSSSEQPLGSACVQCLNVYCPSVDCDLPTHHGVSCTAAAAATAMNALVMLGALRSTSIDANTNRVVAGMSDRCSLAVRRILSRSFTARAEADTSLGGFTFGTSIKRCPLCGFAAQKDNKCSTAFCPNCKQTFDFSKAEVAVFKPLETAAPGSAALVASAGLCYFCPLRAVSKTVALKQALLGDLDGVTTSPSSQWDLVEPLAQLANVRAMAGGLLRMFQERPCNARGFAGGVSFQPLELLAAGSGDEGEWPRWPTMDIAELASADAEPVVALEFSNTIPAPTPPVPAPAKAWPGLTFVQQQAPCGSAFVSTHRAASCAATAPFTHLFLIHAERSATVGLVAHGNARPTADNMVVSFPMDIKVPVSVSGQQLPRGSGLDSSGPFDVMVVGFRLLGGVIQVVRSCMLSPVRVMLAWMDVTPQADGIDFSTLHLAIVNTTRFGYTNAGGQIAYNINGNNGSLVFSATATAHGPDLGIATPILVRSVPATALSCSLRCLSCRSVTACDACAAAYYSLVSALADGDTRATLPDDVIRSPFLLAVCSHVLVCTRRSPERLVSEMKALARTAGIEIAER